MAYVPRTSGTRLVQVAAVEPGYPFYGDLRTQPATAWRELQAGGRVVVDPSLLTALAASQGDTLALGEARFVIAGVVTNAPGNVGFRAALGPRIYIAARDLAGLACLASAPGRSTRRTSVCPPTCRQSSWPSSTGRRSGPCGSACARCRRTSAT